MEGNVTFGSPAKIGFLRAIQVALVVGIVLFLPQASEPRATWLAFVPLVLAEFVLYRVVYARLTSEGLEYRRWRKWKLIKWTEMTRATEHPYTRQISLEIARRPFWRRYLLLSRPTPALSAALDNNSGAARLNALIHGE